jgi:hypothetical protein
MKHGKSKHGNTRKRHFDEGGSTKKIVPVKGLTRDALGFVPYVGQGLALDDIQSDLRGGHYGDAALDSLGLVPVAGGALRKIPRVAKAGRSAYNAIRDARSTEAADAAANAARTALERADLVPVATSAAGNISRPTSPDWGDPIGSMMSAVARAAQDPQIARVVSTEGMSLKRGGNVKRMATGGHVRGCGCESKGKTKGRFR